MTELERLEQLLRSEAPIGAYRAPQRESVVEIIGDELAPHEIGPIFPVKDVPKTDRGEFVRQNINKILPEIEDISQKKRQEELLAKSGVVAGAEKLDTISEQFTQEIERYRSRPRLEPVDWSSVEKNIMNTLSASENPEEIDRTTMLIEAFGPALLGVGFGGQAGFKAAASTKDKLQDTIKDRLKSEYDAKRLRKEAAYKGLEALGKAKEGEARQIEAQAKRDQDELNLITSIIDKYGANTQKSINLLQSIGSKAAEDAIDMMKKGIDVRIEGIKESVDQDLEAEKMKAASIRTQKKAAEKPATEGERKMAIYASQTETALNAYDNLIKRQKGEIPTRDSKLSRFMSALQQSSDPKAHLTYEMLAQYVADPKMLRTLNAELAVMNGILRAETGAAITVGEFLTRAPQLFPRSEDKTEKDLEEKRLKRKNALEALKLAAGRAPISPATISQESYKEKAPTFKVGEEKTLRGQKYRWDGKVWQPKK